MKERGKWDWFLRELFNEMSEYHHGKCVYRYARKKFVSCKLTNWRKVRYLGIIP